jgi:hypothetical protein
VQEGRKLNFHDEVDLGSVTVSFPSQHSGALFFCSTVRQSASYSSPTPDSRIISAELFLIDNATEP